MFDPDVQFWILDCRFWIVGQISGHTRALGCFYRRGEGFEFSLGDHGEVEVLVNFGFWIFDFGLFGILSRFAQLRKVDDRGLRMAGSKILRCRRSADATLPSSLRINALRSAN